MYEIDDNRQGIGALIDSNLLIQVDSVLSGGSIHGGSRYRSLPIRGCRLVTKDFPEGSLSSKLNHHQTLEVKHFFV